MNPLEFCSGDLLADRRAAYAEMLLTVGDQHAACELMREALALAPAWAAGWFRLGEMLAVTGALAAALEAWGTALHLEPEDRLGAALKLELHGGLAGLEAVPSAFVETLFDQYAGTFDEALVERLGYRVPELLHTAIAKTGRLTFSHVLDLGCGTGLMGERLRASASFLHGIDISGEMLKRAEAKRVYDRLEQADLQKIAALPQGADLVTAADVLMYVGALERLFGQVAAVLAAGALFAFSVECHVGSEALALRPSRRYAHAEDYVRDALALAGFDLLSMERAIIRMDRGEPVEGLIVAAERVGRTTEASAADDAVSADEPVQKSCLAESLFWFSSFRS